MESLYLLIPLAVILAGLAVAALLWAVKTGQYEDLEGPAYRILMDDDEAPREVLREGRGESRGEEEPPDPKRENAPKAPQDPPRPPAG
jgi:cbb3-type cytochrome oxidase maturation protein